MELSPSPDTAEALAVATVQLRGEVLGALDEGLTGVRDEMLAAISDAVAGSRAELPGLVEEAVSEAWGEIHRWLDDAFAVVRGEVQTWLANAFTEMRADLARMAQDLEDQQEVLESVADTQTHGGSAADGQPAAGLEETVNEARAVLAGMQMAMAAVRAELEQLTALREQMLQPPPVLVDELTQTARAGQRLEELVEELPGRIAESIEEVLDIEPASYEGEQTFAPLEPIFEDPSGRAVALDQAGQDLPSTEAPRMEVEVGVTPPADEPDTVPPLPGASTAPDLAVTPTPPRQAPAPAPPSRGSPLRRLRNRKNAPTEVFDLSFPRRRPRRSAEASHRPSSEPPLPWEPGQAPPPSLLEEQGAAGEAKSSGPRPVIPADSFDVEALLDLPITTDDLPEEVDQKSGGGEEAETGSLADSDELALGSEWPEPEVVEPAASATVIDQEVEGESRAAELSWPAEAEPELVEEAVEVEPVQEAVEAEAEHVEATVQAVEEAEAELAEAEAEPLEEAVEAEAVEAEAEPTEAESFAAEPVEAEPVEGTVEVEPAHDAVEAEAEHVVSTNDRRAGTRQEARAVTAARVDKASTPHRSRYRAKTLNRLADLWEGIVRQFIDDGATRTPEIEPWFAAYDGEVHYDAVPEPFVGSLAARPKAVILSLNPGPAFAHLHARDGHFVNEMKRAGSYAAWAAQGPDSELPYGRKSANASRLRFLEGWLEPEPVEPGDVVTFELYPWPSTTWTGRIDLNPMVLELIDRYIIEPVAALRPAWVFAFGAEWFRALDGLGFAERVTVGGEHGPTWAGAAPSRVVTVFEHERKRLRVVAMRHRGSPGPPKPAEVAPLRDLLARTFPDEPARRQKNRARARSAT